MSSSQQGLAGQLGQRPVSQPPAPADPFAAAAVPRQGVQQQAPAAPPQPQQQQRPAQSPQNPPQAALPPPPPQQQQQAPAVTPPVQMNWNVPQQPVQQQLPAAPLQQPATAQPQSPVQQPAQPQQPPASQPQPPQVDVDMLRQAVQQLEQVLPLFKDALRIHDEQIQQQAERQRRGGESGEHEGRGRLSRPPTDESGRPSRRRQDVRPSTQNRRRSATGLTWGRRIKKYLTKPVVIITLLSVLVVGLLARGFFWGSGAPTVHNRPSADPARNVNARKVGGVQLYLYAAPECPQGQVSLEVPCKKPLANGVPVQRFVCVAPGVRIKKVNHETCQPTFTVKPPGT